MGGCESEGVDGVAYLSNVTWIQQSASLPVGKNVIVTISLAVTCASAAAVSTAAVSTSTSASSCSSFGCGVREVWPNRLYAFRRVSLVEVG